MKIQTAKVNYRKRCFEVSTSKELYSLPFSKCEPTPSRTNPVIKLYVDPEIGNEGITYILKSGDEGSLHIDYFLHYNKDPSYMRDLLLYELTIEAQHRIDKSGISKREIIRRLGTSPAQFYRIIDQTNYAKTVDQILKLLSVLDCEIQFNVMQKSA